MRDNVPMFAGLRQAGVQLGTAVPKRWKARAEPKPGDYVLERFATSPFNGTQLDSLLGSRSVDTIVLTSAFHELRRRPCGARRSGRGLSIVLIGDATLTMSPERQRATTTTA